MKFFKRYELSEKLKSLNLKEVPQLTDEDRRLIELRLSKVCWKTISKEFKYHRTTAYFKYQKALGKIFHSQITL